MYGRVYLRLMLYVQRGILGITMERHCGQYSVTNCRNVDAMQGCWCDVSTFEDQRSMCRPSKMDDRCANLRRSMALCRPSKIDGVVSTFEDQ